MTASGAGGVCEGNGTVSIGVHGAGAGAAGCGSKAGTAGICAMVVFVGVGTAEPSTILDIEMAGTAP